MYARIERFNLSQGFAELAEELADTIAPIMRRQPGLQSMTMLSDETSGEYIFLTHWETLEQINTYERSPDEWRVRDIVSQHITTVPMIEVFQVHQLAAVAAPEPVAATRVAAEGLATAEAPVAVAVEPTAAVQRATEAGVATVAPIDGICPASHPIKGNHSSSGDFIYHLPGGRFYERTRPEVCFASEQEAQTAGFRAPRA